MAKNLETVYSHWLPLSEKEFNELIFDFENYCERGSMIINKNGTAVPFKLNEAQKAVAKFLMAELFKEIPSPINLFIHKSRQMGISVVIAKLEQYVGTRIPNINMQHVMPTEDDADDLFELKFVPMFQGTHPDLAPEVRKTERRLKFIEYGGVKLGSSLTFSSAQKSSANKGQTNQVVIEDEHAAYERVKSLERGLLATMPKAGRALRVVVSTANGMNHFADLSKIAQASSHWKYLFLPWHMISEYEMEPEGRLALLSKLSDYELQLCEIFERCGYPVASWVRKLAWYDFTYQTEAGLDQDFMFENYPSTAEESFAATGTPVLPAHKLIEFRDAQKSFEYVQLRQDDFGRITVEAAIVSTIKRFKKAIPRHKYSIWVDPAEGGADGDYSAAVVVDLDTMEDVLCIKEKIDQNDFAELLSHIGREYNLATIVVERNMGQSLISWLVNIMKYPRVWIDPLATTKQSVAYGVYMTRKVKNEGIYRLKFLLNNNIYTDYDPEWIEDGLHFVWKKTPSGLQKAEGSEGYHDDTVMARLIGSWTLDMKKYKDYQSSIERK